MKNLITILTLACLMLSSTPAVAQPKPAAITEAETLAGVAKDRYESKDFAGAADLYMRAFAKSKKPATLYNAARAYTEAGNKESAISTFKLYIALTSDEAGVKDAKDRITKLETPAPVIRVQSPVVVRQATPVTSVVTSVVTSGVTSGVAPTPSTPDHTAAWLTSGGAVAALGTGVALMVIGASGTQPGAYSSRDEYDSARTQWISGAVLTGVGVALAGVSSYLWISPTKVAVAPTANGITIGGAF